jgi:hypothetical protein
MNRALRKEKSHKAHRKAGGPPLTAGGLGFAGHQQTWAVSNEGTTLEMSPAGRILSTLGDLAPRSWWTGASHLFAEGASGPVVAIQGFALRLLPDLNTWAGAEYPILSQNGNPITYLGAGW